MNYLFRKVITNYNFKQFYLLPSYLKVVEPKPLALIKSYFASFSHSASSVIKPQLNRKLCLQTQSKAFDVDTNVAKDVIIFKYDNPKFYTMMNIFAVSQFLFWSYLSHFAFTTLKDAPIEKSNPEDAWYKKINLGENKYRNAITVFSFLVGYGILFCAWTFTLRSVRFLILHKGGKTISFVTYGPFNKNRIMSVPLNCISAETSRQSAKVQLPIKVKNKSLFYILDMKGEFTNTKLFDYTAGLKRKLA